jgi:hypothetical protein
MTLRLLSLALLSFLTPLALAQSGGWGDNCPLRVLSNTEQPCGPPAHPHDGHVCNSTVTAQPPAGDQPCKASIHFGRLKVKKSVDPAIIFWKLGNSTGQAKFDVSTGIAVLTDPDSQMYGPQLINDKKFQWNDRNSVKAVSGREVSYEPHVWWRANHDAEWQKCCPIDPKIVNDGP